jgi:diguanylate cyclase (GGDEF)-like protein/putative nucleotidyltransferase with HDIG domain
MSDDSKKQPNRERLEIIQQCTEREGRRKHTEDLLKRYTRDFITLDAAVRDISRARNFDTLVKTAVDIILKATDLESIALYLFDEATGNPVISYHIEGDGGLKEAWGRTPLKARILAKAIETGNIVTLQDILRSPPPVENQGQTPESGDIKTLICVPVKSQARIIGIIVAGSQNKREFSGEDNHLLETLGCQIGAAIGHALLLEKIGKFSHIDHLTGLYNHRYLEEVLEAEIYRGLRCERPFSLVMMDLDGFKAYNDKFGCSRGDRALQALAYTLKSGLRKMDVACRYGGDEFSIVLPATDAQKAQRVVDRIRSIFLASVGTESYEEQSTLGLSAGITQFPQAAVTAHNMIYLAESALDYAKKNNRNKSVLVSDLTMVATSPTYLAAQQVYSLVNFIEAQELFTLGHAKNVSLISGLLGKAIGLSVEELFKLRTAAFLHDIGKSRVPLSLLTKPEMLTGEEREIMKSHALEGARLVARARELKKLVPIVKHHHERYDGTGYPSGLKGDNIPLFSRIICIADAFDTMLRHRSYSQAKSSEDALDEIRRCSGTQFDPKLVSVLVAISDSLS